MREKSISFNQEFVPKILDGKKTQTRRPVKIDGLQKFSSSHNSGFIITHDHSGDHLTHDEFIKKYSKYQKGDTLLVRGQAYKICLKVTDVRVERLQDISEEDAKKEGLGDLRYRLYYEDDYPYAPLSIRWFSSLWNSIYKSRGYGWDANPYVFVYEFERIER